MEIERGRDGRREGGREGRGERNRNRGGRMSAVARSSFRRWPPS